MQRAHAAEQQPRFERAQHGAAPAAHVADALPQLIVARGRERAGDHVGMSVQVLGRRMHHDLRAELDRAREHRRRGRRIDRDDGADLAADLARCGNVGDVPGRICRRLDPDQPGTVQSRLRREVIEHCVFVELDADSPRHREFQQPFAERPIHPARHQHAIARSERLEHGSRSRLARREQHRRRSALQRRDQRFGLVVAGIVGPRVDAPAGISAVGAALVRRRHMDRRDDVAIGHGDAAHALRRTVFRDGSSSCRRAWRAQLTTNCEARGVSGTRSADRDSPAGRERPRAISRSRSGSSAGRTC